MNMYISNRFFYFRRFRGCGPHTCNGCALLAASMVLPIYFYI